MPLVEIVGVTPTGKTFSIAHALIENEQHAAYTWVLQCLRSTLEEGFVVRVALTDRDLALMKAVKDVMPETKLILCKIHIWRNIELHANPSFGSKKDYGSLRHRWDKLVKSITVKEYAENEQRLKVFLADKPNLYKYLQIQWLASYKELFVSCWVDQHRNYRNYTTNRVESEHSLLKSVMHQKRLTFHRIVECVNSVVSGQYTEIKGSLEHCRQYNQNKHNYPCLKDLLGKASHVALQIMVDEIDRLKNTLKGDVSKCGCTVWARCGLPCSYRLLTYMQERRRVQEYEIDAFWCRLDINPSTCLPGNVKKDSDDDEPVEDFCGEVTTNLERQPIKQRKSLMSKIKDLIYPGRSKIKDPEVQKKTRGRPIGSKKKMPDLNVSPPMPPPPKMKKSRSVHVTTPKYPDTAPDSGSCYRDFQSARHSDHVPTQSRFAEPDTELREDTRGYIDELIRSSQFSAAGPSNEPTTEPSFLDQLFGAAEPAYYHVPPTAPTGVMDQFFSADTYFPAGPSTPMPAAPSSYFDFFTTPTQPLMPPAPSPISPISAEQQLAALPVPPPNTRPLQTTGIKGYLDDIPNVFRPYVKGIINVSGDGNCGFRALAVALGYDENEGYEWIQLHMLAEYENNKQFYDELTRWGQAEARFFEGLSRFYVGVFRPTGYWMHMTMGAMLLSNRMGIVINCLSTAASWTSFPFTYGPDEMPRTEPISIALVHGHGHYIMVQLEGDYPMAPEIAYWVQDRVRPLVSKWKDLYRHRQLAYNRYIDATKPPPIYMGTVDSSD
uniref:uncharacterized protein LOC122588668 n=1 Tax=Erigeron canadensis TaxID=72917 RepID=UPI001CB8BB63|nr:uncharacterized protein LOC122588668 [Erigeron canadensis]